MDNYTKGDWTTELGIGKVYPPNHAIVTVVGDDGNIKAHIYNAPSTEETQANASSVSLWNNIEWRTPSSAASISPQ